VTLKIILSHALCHHEFHSVDLHVLRMKRGKRQLTSFQFVKRVHSHDQHMTLCVMQNDLNKSRVNLSDVYATGP